MMKAKPWMGYVAMLMANMIWGAMSPITKNVLEQGDVSGLSLAALRIIGGTLLFIVTGMFLPASVAPREKIRKEDRLKIFIASFLMITINQGLYILGISFTSPVDSAVMSTLTPVFTMIFAAIFLRYPITWLKGAGVVLGLAGALIITFLSATVTPAASNPPLGNTLCLIAQICAALYYVIFKDIITRYSPFTLMKQMFIYSALTFGVVMLPWLVRIDYGAFTGGAWWSIAYIIVFATFIGYLLIPFSQKLIKPTAVAIFTYFQPVTAGILSAVMGLAVFGPAKVLATLLIFLGVLAVSRSKS